MSDYGGYYDDYGRYDYEPEPMESEETAVDGNEGLDQAEYYRE